jgi:hypothetical protein
VVIRYCDHFLFLPRFGADQLIVERMAEDIASGGRVTFGRGYNVWIMGIDGTWRRNCVLTAVSSHDAQLTLESSIEGLNLKEFFLLLSSTGLAYRRCELVKVNGAQIDIRFVSTKGPTKKKSSRSDSEMAMA